LDKGFFFQEKYSKIMNQTVSKSFKDLHLIEPLLRALDQEGYTTPTPIQAQAIPHILDHGDLLACAQTGTGKTFAYLLPCLRQWKFNKDKDPQILVIVKINTDKAKVLN
jgi:ATP-dependent RNA helicase RhlE